MNTDTEKIGRLIAHIRQQRGLTQAEFAKRMGTSQSAVNRIEKGNQNMSIEMLGRISDVLDKEIISISSGHINFRIEGGKELSGKIDTKVSKNAAVALLCASLLNHGVTTLKKVPRIEEVYRIIEVLESLGVSVRWMEDNNLEIKRPAKLKIDSLNAVAAKRTRSVLMLLGSLIHEFDEFKIPFAGGCKLGTRTVQPHLHALNNFGVDIVAYDDYYGVKADISQPEPIVMSEMSDTATENAIMAAVGFKGTTVVKFASHNYMVRDLCYFVKKLGVKIDGIGTNTLTITSPGRIKKNIAYSPSEDPIESMMFISLAVTTNSSITIKRSPIDFLELEILKLKQMGVEFEISKTYKADNGFTNLADITVKKHGKLVAPEDKIHPLSYPGINMDNLPFFVPVAAKARGQTLIHDWPYENRAIYFTELNKLGASIVLADPHRVYVDGPTEFESADLVCPPALRPAVIVLIAMMAAKGTSVLRNIYSISRGYEDLANRLNSLGADVTTLRDI